MLHFFTEYMDKGGVEGGGRTETVVEGGWVMRRMEGIFGTV